MDNIFDKKAVQEHTSDAHLREPLIHQREDDVIKKMEDERRKKEAKDERKKAAAEDERKKAAEAAEDERKKAAEAAEDESKKAAEDESKKKAAEDERKKAAEAAEDESKKAAEDESKKKAAEDERKEDDEDERKKNEADDDENIREDEAAAAAAAAANSNSNPPREDEAAAAANSNSNPPREDEAAVAANSNSNPPPLQVPPPLQQMVQNGCLGNCWACLKRFVPLSKKWPMRKSALSALLISVSSLAVSGILTLNIYSATYFLSWASPDSVCITKDKDSKEISDSVKENLKLVMIGLPFVMFPLTLCISGQASALMKSFGGIGLVSGLVIAEITYVFLMGGLMTICMSNSSISFVSIITLIVIGFIILCWSCFCCYPKCLRSICYCCCTSILDVEADDDIELGAHLV